MISYGTWRIFHQYFGWSILVLRSSWVRFGFSICNKFTSQNSVPYVILLMTLLNVSATQGIVTTTFGSWDNWKHWMPLQWSCLYLWKKAGHWILSLQRIPLPFFTDYSGKVVLCHIHPLFKGNQPQYRQRQPHYKFLSQQFANHCCCHQGESLSNTHFICHQCSWHIRVSNPPPYNEPDGMNQVRQKLSSGEA